jgi:large subunit ribosomal protein L9
MKIVLRQDVPKVGEAGTVQTVSDGYARNYLIPRGFAVAATKGELKVAEHNLAVKARKIAKQEQQLQSLADRIDGQRLEFTARAGRQGRLYGSITAGDIAERLSVVVRDEIDRRKVVLDESIRTVGEHSVAIHLVGRLRPHVTVIVNGEVDEEEEAPEAEGETAESEDAGEAEPVAAVEADAADDA